MFTPVILQSLRGYNRATFVKDCSAGITVGIVALPLAMAFGIASGVKPEQGLTTAIIAGFIVALLGGVRLQVAGPAGAFIGLLYSIVERYGSAGLLVSTMAAGVLIFALGALRMGNLIRYVPMPVILGFTNGIAVIIALAQLRDLLGLNIAKMPSNFFAQLKVLWAAIATFNVQTMALSLATIACLLAWPKLTRRLNKLPGSLAAIVVGATVTAVFHLNVETIGTRFGAIPNTVFIPQFPELWWSMIPNLIGPILAIAFLGAVESLLCARVADQLSGDQHQPNQELMAQGIANIVTPLFGGFAATGTLARTVTNIKSGAQTPVASAIHAITLLLIVWLLAPFAKHIPMASLAAVLFVVAINMGDWAVFKAPQAKRGDRFILVTSFILTVVSDITIAVAVGLLLSLIFYFQRTGWHR